MTKLTAIIPAGNEIHNIEGVVLIDIDDDGDFYTYVLDPAKQIFEL